MSTAQTDQTARPGGRNPGATSARRKSYLDTVPGMAERLERIGLRRKSMELAAAAWVIANRERPLTLRGLFYRIVSAGLLPSTDRKYYAALGRLATTMRERAVMPFEWLVDNVR